MTEQPQADIAALSFEAAYAELSQLIEAMESGDLTLAESVAQYERGHQLAAHCDRLLEQAELRVNQLNVNGQIDPLD
jgi:exodeoxyribonuclease VII small subunit